MRLPKKSRVQKFQQPKTVADNDVTIADSGTTVGVANLTLPGDFAFNNQGTSEMKPEIRLYKIKAVTFS